MVYTATSVDHRGIGSMKKSLPLLLIAFGEELARKASTKEQRQAAHIVQRTAREVSEMIMERFNTDFENKIEAEQKFGKSSAVGDAVLQGLYMTEIVDGDDAEQERELTTDSSEDNAE